MKMFSCKIDLKMHVIYNDIYSRILYIKKHLKKIFKFLQLFIFIREQLIVVFTSYSQNTRNLEQH